MSPLSRPFFLAMSALLSVVGSGCGASMDAMYEGEVRFEHCMALDARPQVSARERRRCWRDWLAYYTYGQSKDRVDHAQSRVGALERQP